MLLLYVLLLLLTICGVGVFVGGGNPLDRNLTTSVKGVFILTVFIRHAHPYVSAVGGSWDTWLDRWGLAIDCWLGQLIVAMFLFYSGFGVMSAILAKGSAYVDSIPRHRFGNVLLNFMVAVLVYVALGGALGRELTVRRVLLSLIGWESMGNSNWYIFCILCAYLMSCCAFKVTRNPRKALVVMSGLAFAYCVVMYYVKQGWWYDTMLCFPLGAAVALWKDKMLGFLNNYRWACLSIALCCLFVFTYVIHIRHFGLGGNLRAMSFCFLLLIVTMFVRIDNAPLRWLGKHLFPLYIYQRVPMIVLSTLGEGWLCVHTPLLFVLCCVLLTIPFVWFYRCVEIRL